MEKGVKEVRGGVVGKQGEGVGAGVEEQGKGDEIREEGLVVVEAEDNETSVELPEVVGRAGASEEGRE